MFENARVAVVVPAYNERRLLGRTLRSVPPFVDRVIVVDDGSTDGTSEIAHATGDPRVEVASHPVNRGVGAAIATGYRLAFAAGVDIAAVMAGDAQMDPRDLAKVIAPIARGEADYVKGDRLSHPTAWRAIPIHRLVANHVLSRLTGMATGLRVRDSQCGYTALSRRAASIAGVDAMWPGYGYPNDLLGRVSDAGLRVREVVVRPVYGDERSKLRVHHGLVVVPYVLACTALRRTARAASEAT
jgi:glycosyltransferase involved in cell wall biosynthesis